MKINTKLITLAITTCLTQSATAMSSQAAAAAKTALQNGRILSQKHRIGMGTISFVGKEEAPIYAVKDAFSAAAGKYAEFVKNFSKVAQNVGPLMTIRQGNLKDLLKDIAQGASRSIRQINEQLAHDLRYTDLGRDAIRLQTQAQAAITAVQSQAALATEYLSQNQDQVMLAAGAAVLGGLAVYNDYIDQKATQEETDGALYAQELARRQKEQDAQRLVEAHRRREIAHEKALLEAARIDQLIADHANRTAAQDITCGMATIDKLISETYEAEQTLADVQAGVVAWGEKQAADRLVTAYETKSAEQEVATAGRLSRAWTATKNSTKSAGRWIASFWR